MLEIISEGEVTKHLKKRQMTCCLTNILNISCTDTLLTGCYSALRRNLLSREIWLEWCHTRIDQQKAVIIVRNQRKALHRQMILAFKKVQIHSSKLIYSILLHVYPPFCTFPCASTNCMTDRPEALPALFFLTGIKKKPLIYNYKLRVCICQSLFPASKPFHKYKLHNRIKTKLSKHFLDMLLILIRLRIILQD